ncbi:MAG: TlpA family protein disulfide reductase [Burkholderiaceae bacterium]|nr:TlpA family protein disulfide reductase [Burkholderiaceae bacterium]
MKKRTLILGAGGLAAIGAAGFGAWRASSQGAPQANKAVSARAAQGAAQDGGAREFFDTSMPDLQGQAVALSTFIGKPLLANFWATWCAPCVEEMPHLDAMAKSTPGVQFVGIGIDTAANIQKFVDKIPVSYRLLVAGHAGIALCRALGNSAGGLPFTVLFDAKGNKFDAILGEVQPGDLQSRIARLVAVSRT